MCCDDTGMVRAPGGDVSGEMSGSGDWVADGFDSGFDERDADELMTGEAVALDLRPTGLVLSAAGAAIDFLVYLAPTSSLW